MVPSLFNELFGALIEKIYIYRQLLLQPKPHHHFATTFVIHIYPRQWHQCKRNDTRTTRPASMHSFNHHHLHNTYCDLSLIITRVSICKLFWGRERERERFEFLPRQKDILGIYNWLGRSQTVLVKERTHLSYAFDVCLFKK